MKYKRRSNYIDDDFQYYLGEEGLFGHFFGHKLTKNQYAKKNYIWNTLVKQFDKNQSIWNRKSY